MLGFIIALIAGFLSPYAQAPLARPVARSLSGFLPLEETEEPILSFILCMLIGAVLAAILHSGTPFWFMVGGAVGYFAMRLMAAARAAIDKTR